MLVYELAPPDCTPTEFEAWFKRTWRALQKHYNVKPQRVTREQIAEKLETSLTAMEYHGSVCEGIRGKNREKRRDERRFHCAAFADAFAAALSICECTTGVLAKRTGIGVNALDGYAAGVSVPMAANRQKMIKVLRHKWEEL